MKMDFQKIRERLGLSSDKPLTPEEKRRRARYIVYPFFCLLCAGFLLLVFSPSEKEKAEKEKGKGFNVEMPSPKDSEMEGDKVSAYEQEALAKKEKWRRGTFQEMSKLLNKDSQDTAGLTAGKANTELPPEPETGKSPGSVHSSAEAYRNMNRSLGAVYTRNENQQNADLLRRIEELEKEKRPAEGQPEGQTLEEKMALLEKSYELAARYNGKQPDAPAAVNGRSDRKDRTAVRPVKQVQNQVVSSLAQPMGNEDFIAEFAGERNTGFHTPIGRTLPSGRNTIAACVHGTQTVSDGQVLRIRLLEPMAVEIVAVGGVDSCAVDVKNIFKHALLNNASYIICFHNHPSGYTLPSREDEKFTERLVTAGRILNLPMIDHIIVGDDDFYSFRENGKLEIFPESDAVA